LPGGRLASPAAPRAQPETRRGFSACLPVERDQWFEGEYPLSVYARAARRAEGVVTDREALEAAERNECRLSHATGRAGIAAAAELPRLSEPIDDAGRLTQIDAIGPHELKNGADAAGGRDKAKHQLALALLLFPLSPVCSFAQDKTAPPPSINEPLGGCPDATDPKETALFKIIQLGPMRVEKMGKLRLAGSNVEMAASAAPLSAIGELAAATNWTVLGAAHG
jgi:hypothetical protein